MTNTMTKVVNIVKQAHGDIAAVLQKIKELQKNAGNYAPAYYNAQMMELEGKRTEIIRNAESSVRNVLSERKIDSDAVQFDAVNPAFMAVINSGLPVSVEELRAQFLKSAAAGDRSTMLMVERYAMQRNMTDFGLHVYTEDEQIAANDVVYAYARSALARPEYADVWFDAEYLENAEPEAMKRSYSDNTPQKVPAGIRHTQGGNYHYAEDPVEEEPVEEEPVEEEPVEEAGASDWGY